MRAFVCLCACVCVYACIAGIYLRVCIVQSASACVYKHAYMQVYVRANVNICKLDMF